MSICGRSDEHLYCLVMLAKLFFLNFHALLVYHSVNKDDHLNH